MDATKCNRLIGLRDSLMDGGRLSIPSIMRKYEVTRRTATRDLEELRAMGLDLEPEVTDAGVRYWRLPRRNRELRVRYSFLDVMSLFMGRRLFDFLENTSLESSFDRVYQRIEEQLVSTRDLDNAAKLEKKVFIIHEGPKKLPASTTEVLDTCLDGLINESKLAVRYRNSKGKLRNYKVHPYSLVAYKRGLYLVARIEEWDRTSVLTLERITSAKWLKEPFRYPKTYDPERYFKGALFIMPGEPEPVELLFTATSKPFIRYRRFHRSQKLTTLEDGRLMMTLEVPLSAEVVNWIASFREHVEVVKPEALREQVRKSLKKTLAQYE